MNNGLVFDVTIWGTVADWVGSLGTSGALAATAYFYFRDQATKNAAQARLVRFTTEGLGIASRYELTNNSDGSIYDVMLWWDPPLTLEAMFKRKWGVYGVKHWIGDLNPEFYSDANILRNFNDMPIRTKLAAWGNVGAHQTFKNNVPSTCDISNGGPLYIEFRDAGGRHWYKEPDKEPAESRSSWLRERRRRLLVMRKSTAAKVRARYRARRVLRSVKEATTKDKM